MVVVVSSSSRDKLARLTWAEVDDPANWVMFDLSGRGTLKLVSVLERLDDPAVPLPMLGWAVYALLVVLATTAAALIAAPITKMPGIR